MAITTKFRKGESLFATTLSSGISTGTGETITLASVSGLPTDTPITLTFDRVDADAVATPTKTERITGTISGSALTSYTRGTDGSTEQAHSAAAVVEYVFNSQDLNDMIDGILVGHTQAGAHATDTISEKTATAGVTIDGVKLKDSQPYCDVINEKTSATGVTIDGILLKDDLDTSGIVGKTTTQTLTNKTLTTPVIASLYQDAGKTKLMTTPNTASDTLCAIAATQTLTNKTLTKPTVNGSVQAYTTDSDGATVTFDMAASNIHTVVLGGNRTLAVSNTSTGQSFIIRLVQDGTGTRTVTWFAGISWAAATAPTLTTTLNKTDVFGFICTGANTYDGFIVDKNL